jgi:hypothetical protein
MASCWAMGRSWDVAVKAIASRRDSGVGAGWCVRAEVVWAPVLLVRVWALLGCVCVVWPGRWFVDDEVLCEVVVCVDVVCVEELGLCEDVVWLWAVVEALCGAVVVGCVALVLWCVVGVVAWACVVWACVVKDIATSAQGNHGSFMLSFGPRFRFLLTL